MRPVPPGNRPLNHQTRGRPDSLNCGPSTAPVACFLTTEADLDAGRTRSPPRFRPHHDARKWTHGSCHRSPANYTSHAPTPHPAVPESVASSSVDDQEIQDPLTCPGTPTFLDLSGPESALSSTSSRRSSIVGPSVDHHSDFLDESLLSGIAMSEIRDNDSSVPQLIMPSLTVPRRRPFSNVGKSLGKLKIMVAGRPGIGKTSLVLSLAQRCEHIVHIDQIESNGAMQVAEFYASSRPHPWWKTDSQASMSNARRKSLTAGEMLDRNVCFVESPSGSNGFSNSWQDLSYVKSHLSRLLTKPMDDADLFALLNAGGEPIVDVLLYLIPHKGLEDDDIEYIKNAQQMTNVVPVLARVDELGSSDEVEAARQKISRTLVEEGLECFSFADATTEATSQVYVVSTETRTDYDTMDASVLMDSEYIPPLVPTDLSKLVDGLFSLDGSAQLRHCAAVKSVDWRRRYGGALQVAVQNQSMQVVHAKPLRVSAAHRAQCWERLDFYNWANNLRQSLHTQQLRYLVSEKAVHGVAPESRLARIAPAWSERRRSETSGGRQRHQDPLGILEIGGRFKQRGMLALEMVTSVGIIGYAVTQLVRADWAEETCSVAFAGTRRIGMEVPGLGTIVFW